MGCPALELAGCWVELGLSVEMEISGRALADWCYVGPGGLWWFNILNSALPPQRVMPDTQPEHQDPVSHTARAAILSWSHLRVGHPVVGSSSRAPETPEGQPPVRGFLVRCSCLRDGRRVWVMQGVGHLPSLLQSVASGGLAGFWALLIFIHTPKQGRGLCFPTPPSNSLILSGHWLSYKYNSILTLCAWRQHQIPQVRGSVHRSSPASNASHKSRLSPVLLTHWL